MKVVFTKSVLKSRPKLPKTIWRKLVLWAESVESKGLEEIRKNAGFHDEPLKGKRKGQRSIRLNQQWRAIYEIQNDELIIYVLEVTPHDY